MDGTKGNVLVVTWDGHERVTLADRLELAGYDVEICPGPHTPDFVCLGGRGLPCPLAAGADVVVLDLRLASDEAMQGTPGWHLMLYYLGLGRPVIALAGADDPVRPRPDRQVTVLERPVDPADVVRAVEQAHRRPFLTSRGG